MAKIGIDIRPLVGSKYGGVGEYIKNILPALFELGKNHEFHLFENSHKEDKSLDRSIFNFSNVQVHTFNYYNKFFTFSNRYLNKPYIDKMIGGVDIFFSPHFMPAPVLEKTKKIITFHDISFEYFPKYFDMRRRIWHKYISPRVQAYSADAIIAVSESTKQDIIEFYKIPQEKIQVVHLGISDSIINPEKYSWKNIKQKYKIKDNYILSLSTIEPRKNINALIRAFNMLKMDTKFKELNLVIAGPRGWSYKEIIKEANESPYRNQIIFTGLVREEEKYPLYKNAKLFVYPSLYEGFGFPPLEAMRSGTPTIVSMMASLPEITRGAALMINPYIPKDILLAIREILSDERLAKDLSRRGILVAKEFDWLKSAKETLNIFEENVDY